MIGAYFSKPDWHTEYYWWPKYATADRNNNYDIRKYPWRWNKFKEFTYNQISELMHDYGSIDILWLDGGWVRLLETVNEEVLSWGARIPEWNQDIDMPKTAAKAYRNYFDPETRFVRGRLSENAWRSPFSPFESRHMKDDFAEGNAWQYTWLVPHDVEGLIELLGGEEAFTKNLNSLFVLNVDMGKEASNDITGLIGQYAHGNEPSHHITYLYAFVGQPWKTAEKVRYILDSLYSDKFDGLCGNENVGQMSAWYVFSALGFYPVNPSNGLYVFGSPLVNKATLKLENGKTLQVNVRNNHAGNKYIQRITLNGKSFTRSFILHQELMKGGVLQIDMGAQPSGTWGRNKKDRPYSGIR